MASKIGLVLMISSIAFAEASLLDLIWKSIVLDRTQASTTINCTSEGYMCSLDCQTVYQCIGSSPNFGTVTVEKCNNSEGYYCSTSLGKCSSTFSSTCRPPAYQFQCTSIGVFPDPYDCSVYHICYGDTTSPTDSEEQCETGWLYNAGTETCLTQASKCTEDPVPTCTAEGQVGPLESNPTIYYECVENTEYGYYYPVLYACPHGGEFDDTLKSCVDRVVTYSPSTPISTTELSSTETSTKLTTAETSPETSSTDLSTETSTPETSPETSSTDLSTETSAPETSPETSSTDLSTETSAPETSPETSSTEPSTETETSTIPSSTTPAPFQCLTPGVFGDPYACQYYYRCTDDLEQYHYKCTDGFHWNEVLKDCLYGPCLQ